MFELGSVRKMHKSTQQNRPTGKRTKIQKTILVKNTIDSIARLFQRYFIEKVTISEIVGNKKIFYLQRDSNLESCNLRSIRYL